MQDPTKLLQSCYEVGPIKNSLCLTSLPTPIHKGIHEGGWPPKVQAVRSAAGFMDGCGEAGDGQGILNGSNFAAASLQLGSNFEATLSHLVSKG